MCRNEMDSETGENRKYLRLTAVVKMVTTNICYEQRRMPSWESQIFSIKIPENDQ